MYSSHTFLRSLSLVIDPKPGESPQRGAELYIISVVTVVIAGLFVAARLGTRLSSSIPGQGLGKDDVCVVAALISSVSLSITEIEATVHGYGNHKDDLSISQVHQALEWFFYAQIVYKVVITLNKMALLLFYLRVFPSRTFRLLCYAGFTFVAVSGFAYIVATIFQCNPIAYYWNRSPGGHCIQSAPFWISYGSINIATDFYILGLPMPLLYSLNLSKRSKLEMMGCFAMGGFVCFTTIIRMTTLARSASGTDFTYGPVPATNWSVIEANTGLICTCLPMMKQYINIITRLLGHSQPGINAQPSRNTPRTRNFRTRRFNLTSLKSRDEIVVTREWSTVPSSAMSLEVDDKRLYRNDQKISDPQTSTGESSLSEPLKA